MMPLPVLRPQAETVHGLNDVLPPTLSPLVDSFCLSSSAYSLRFSPLLLVAPSHTAEPSGGMQRSNVVDLE